MSDIAPKNPQSLCLKRLKGPVPDFYLIYHKQKQERVNEIVILVVKTFSIYNTFLTRISISNRPISPEPKVMKTPCFLRWKDTQPDQGRKKVSQSQKYEKTILQVHNIDTKALNETEQTAEMCKNR